MFPLFLMYLFSFLLHPVTRKGTVHLWQHHDLRVAHNLSSMFLNRRLNPAPSCCSRAQECWGNVQLAAHHLPRALSRQNCILQRHPSYLIITSPNYQLKKNVTFLYLWMSFAFCMHFFYAGLWHTLHTSHLGRGTVGTEALKNASKVPNWISKGHWPWLLISVQLRLVSPCLCL